MESSVIDSPNTENNVEESLDGLETIRGDAIGDTVYSERWVLRVLIKLSELTEESWCDDLEQDLCLLWDMTSEKDVVLFLKQHDFFDLFCKVIRATNSARCIEIMVGLAGNMACNLEARQSLAEHEAAIILINLITSEDSLVLVQLLRLLNTCLWTERGEQESRSNSPTSSAKKNEVPETIENLSPWLRVISPNCELLLRHLGFFLSSAINDDLLCSTLELLDTLLKIPILKLSPVLSRSHELACGLAECLRQLLRGARTGDSITANRRLCKAYDFWLNIVGVVASCQEGRTNLSAVGDLLTKCFTKLIILLTTPEALKTQEPEMAILCLCVLETLPRVPITAPVLARLVIALYNMENDIENENENAEVLMQATQLYNRSLHFLKQRLEEADDVVPMLEALSSRETKFLLAVVSSHPSLLDKINRNLLQIRTNGLVQ